MTTALYLHWNKKELQDKIKILEVPGLKIDPHWTTEETVKFGDSLPDIFIISLDRLPSHGRQYARWLWEAKYRQNVPIIFVDGKPDKVEQIKQEFSKALYCKSDHLLTIINNIMKNEN